MFYKLFFSYCVILYNGFRTKNVDSGESFDYYLFENDYFEPCSPDDEALSWISVESPTEEEIERLVNQYHLPTDYLTGVLDDEENARVEGFRHEKLQTPTLLLFRYPKASISLVAICK